MDGDFYSSLDVRSAERVESLIMERMGEWRPVEPRPGAVILFRVWNRDAHVGLVLSPTDFVHSFGGEETTILRLENDKWAKRRRGFYDTTRGDDPGDHIA